VEHAAGAACPQLVRAVRYLSRGPASRQVLVPRAIITGKLKSYSATKAEVMPSVDYLSTDEEE
jgi:hypothetical protein